MRKRLAILALAAMLSPAALALSPEEQLQDPALEQRARSISAELRCLVCQNQSIDDSDAPLAKDLRLLVREQLLSGKSDGQVMDFIVARYGDYVLLKPRFNRDTILLWVTPFAALLIAAAVLVLRRRRPRPQPVPETPLSDAEREALRKALE